MDEVSQEHFIYRSCKAFRHGTVQMRAGLNELDLVKQKIYQKYKPAFN